MVSSVASPVASRYSEELRDVLKHQVCCVLDAVICERV